MPFFTIRQVQRHHQITLDEIIAGEIKPSNIVGGDPTGTVTRFSEKVPESINSKVDIDSIISALETFMRQNQGLYGVQDKRTLYSSFSIPKKSGGRRHIDAPCDALKEALRELKYLLEDKCGALYHTSAFAYVSGRSTVDAIKKHQSNGSRWFLKTDFSNFFGNTTPEFTMKMLSRVYPFSEIVAREDGKQALTQVLDLCFLDGGLPQGTPISPMLTNLVMIPIDYAFAKELWSKGYAYTRYADDILISHKQGFMVKDVLAYMRQVLDAYQAPFTIKPEKTRYGSSAGSNWNLGVMLNKDNNITIGHQRKRELKAMSHNFIEDFRRGVLWDAHDAQVLAGLLSYYKMVEPAYMTGLIRHINRKHHCNLPLMINQALKGNVI